jgi:hypothetical protein
VRVSKLRRLIPFDGAFDCGFDLDGRVGIGFSNIITAEEMAGPIERFNDLPANAFLRPTEMAPRSVANMQYFRPASAVQQRGGTAGT